MHTNEEMQQVGCKLFEVVKILHGAVKVLGVGDKKRFVEKTAAEMAWYSSTGDTAKCYAVARRLSKFAPRPLPAVKLEDGTLATDPTLRAERWVRHFCATLSGQALDSAEETAVPAPPPLPITSFVPTVEDIGAAIAKLGSGKAAGPDAIPAEVLKAGGWTAACALHVVIDQVVREQRWPYKWKGGRMATLWKRKGSPQVCSDHRGLLIADHAGKVATSLVKDAIEPAVAALLPESQAGGRAGKCVGTDFPAHTMRMMCEYARATNTSIGLLFLDLTQAFDRVLREIAMGWPVDAGHSYDTAEARRNYLESIGVEKQVARHIVEHIAEHGTVMEQARLDPVLQRLVAGLHTRAWFSFEGTSKVVASTTGGRQGCKLGSLVFCAVYDRALREVRELISEEDIACQLQLAESSAFWEAPPPNTPGEAMQAEVTYVDDEALAVVATTAKRLRVTMQKVVAAYSRVFRSFGLEINWKKGKSELMWVLRGKRASEQLDMCRSPGGLLLNAEGLESGIHVVASYAHLGGILSNSGSMVPEARARRSSMMASFGPLAVRIFGQQGFSMEMRLDMASSLLWSKLLYNVVTWTMQPQALKILDDAHMRVLRRIAGRMRGNEHDGKHSTALEVRRELRAPSLECIIVRRRLMYYARLAIHRPRMLWALLQARPNNTPLPYAKQAMDDFAVLQAHCPQAAKLPDVSLAPKAWLSIITFERRLWSEWVREVWFDESVFDTDRIGCGTLSEVRNCAHVCTDCNLRFVTRKAMLAHRRVKHGDRCVIRTRVPDTGTCPVCCTEFHARRRLIAHLTDRRRTRCRDIFLASDPPELPPERLDEIAAAERMLLRQARAQGHVHVLATASARTANGSRIGRVQQ
jgi:hypothetical protein